MSIRKVTQGEASAPRFSEKTSRLGWMMWWLASLECSPSLLLMRRSTWCEAYINCCCDEQEMDEETKKQLEEAHELTLHRPRLFRGRCSQ